MRLARIVVPVFVFSTLTFAESGESHIVRDGSTPERAVIVRQPSAHKTVDWEWRWIKAHHPSTYALGWMHQCVCEHHRVYDLYILETPAGKRNAYFDVGEKCD
jgi:hypothetical protein